MSSCGWILASRYLINLAEHIRPRHLLFNISKSYKPLNLIIGHFNYMNDDDKFKYIMSQQCWKIALRYIH